MKKISSALLLLALIGVAGLAATSNGRFVRREVAGHRFVIPKDYLFQETIAWLPLAEGDSFVFLLRPSADSNRFPKHRVLVESLARHCPGDASQMLRIACGLEKASFGDGPPYEKRQSELGSWASDLYSVRDIPGASRTAERQIAYCQRFEANPAKPRVSNRCTTFWAHKGMFLQFDFEEAELSNLIGMKRGATQLLDSWEIK
jgi:hypothetical protein